MMFFVKLSLAVCKQTSCWMVINLVATKVWLLLKLRARSAFSEGALLLSVQSGNAIRVLKLGDRWGIAVPVTLSMSASLLAWIPAVTTSR